VDAFVGAMVFPTGIPSAQSGAEASGESALVFGIRNFGLTGLNRSGYGQQAMQRLSIYHRITQ